MANKIEMRDYMTTVKELIETLSELPEDSVVILQKDSEGNGYSPLAGLEAAKYIPGTTCNGEVPCNEDIESGELEEEDVAKMLDCVVLWPTN